MSKQYKIRWTKSDNNELARVVRNYNAKLERLAKNPSRLRNEITEKSRVADTTLINALPEKTSVREMKSLINTRQDLKRELNTLKRFLEKGAEELVNTPDTKYNVFVTKFQRKEMSIRAGVVNRRRKRRLDSILESEATSGGEALGYKVGQIGMGKIDLVSLKPFNAFTPTMKQIDIRYKWKSLLYESQSDFYEKEDARVKESFIKGIKWNFDSLYTEELIEYLEKMPVSQFMKIFRKEGNTFEWLYEPDPDEDFYVIEHIKKAYGMNVELLDSRDIVGSELKKKYKAKEKLRESIKKYGVNEALSGEADTISKVLKTKKKSKTKKRG